MFLLAVVAARLLTRARLGETPLLLAFLARESVLVQAGVALAVGLLVAAGVAVAAVVLGMGRGGRTRRLRPAFGLLVAHNLVHYLSFDSHYRPAVASLIQTSVVVNLLWD